MSIECGSSKISSKKIKMVFKNVPVDFINQLRILALRDIPTFAMDRVYIYKNQTALNDEMLIHRLAMVPFIVPKKNFLNGKDIHIYLKGIGKKHQQYITIRQLLKNPPIQVNIDGDIVIAPIRENQQIEIQAILSLGTFQDHAKWQTCNAYLFHEKYHSKKIWSPEPLLQKYIQQAFDHYSKHPMHYPKCYYYTTLTIESLCNFTASEILILACLKFLQT